MPGSNQATQGAQRSVLTVGFQGLLPTGMKLAQMELGLFQREKRPDPGDTAGSGPRIRGLPLVGGELNTVQREPARSSQQGQLQDLRSLCGTKEVAQPFLQSRSCSWDWPGRALSKLEAQLQVSCKTWACRHPLATPRCMTTLNLQSQLSSHECC